MPVACKAQVQAASRCRTSRAPSTRLNKREEGLARARKTMQRLNAGGVQAGGGGGPAGGGVPGGGARASGGPVGSSAQAAGSARPSGGPVGATVQAGGGARASGGPGGGNAQAGRSSNAMPKARTQPVAAIDAGAAGPTTSDIIVKLPPPERASEDDAGRLTHTPGASPKPPLRGACGGVGNTRRGASSRPAWQRW